MLKLSGDGTQILQVFKLFLSIVFKKRFTLNYHKISFQSYRERMRINQVVRELELEMAEQDYINERKAALRWVFVSRVTE